MASGRSRFIKDTLLVTLVVSTSKAIGFAREMIVAYYYGSTRLTDAYNSAYSLFYVPVLLFSSCLTSTLVPMYNDAEHALGASGANRFASNVVNLFSVFAVLISVLMMFLSDALVRWVYPGFSPDKHALTVHLSQIMYPALVFYVASIAFTSILNAKEKYVAAQLTGFPLSVSLITSAVAFSGSVGIVSQAWGVFVAGVLQMVVLYPFLVSCFSYTSRFSLHDRRFKRLFELAVPAILAMAVNELNHMIDHALASVLPDGDLSAMSYAFKLITFMLGVLVVPMTTIMFSKMAKRISERDRKGAAHLLHESIETVMLLLLPFVAVMLVSSRSVIRLAYGRGEFSESAIAITGQVLFFYGLGVPFFALRDLLNRAYHSLKDMRTPMRISTFSVGVNIIGNLLLRDVMGANGLALSTSIAGMVGASLLAIRLRGRFGVRRRTSFLWELFKIILSALVCAAAAYLLVRVMPEPSSPLSALGVLLVAAAGGFIAYGLACWVLGVRALTRILRSIFGRKRGVQPPKGGKTIGR